MSDPDIAHQIMRAGPPLTGNIKAQCEPKLEVIGELIGDLHARPGEIRRARLAAFTFIVTVLSAAAAIVTIVVAFHR